VKRTGTLPWESPNSGRGRPRKEPERTGCPWPVPATGSTCGERTVEGLALCATHAAVLQEPPGGACAWPLCSQSAPFHVMCAYHLKRAMGLLEPAR
jgi:hypothetical protein